MFIGKVVRGKERRRNNCRLPDVGHVFNVPGTMESCPTHFCLSPKPTKGKKETQKIPPTERRGYVSYRPAPDALIILMIKSSNRITDGD